MASTPRWMTDEKLIEAFGLSRKGLRALRINRDFPQRDPVLHKTDSRAVDAFFDKRSGISVQSFSTGPMAHDGEENFVQ